MLAFLFAAPLGRAATRAPAPHPLHSRPYARMPLPLARAATRAPAPHPLHPRPYARMPLPLGRAAWGWVVWMWLHRAGSRVQPRLPGLFWWAGRQSRGWIGRVRGALLARRFPADC